MRIWFRNWWAIKRARDIATPPAAVNRRGMKIGMVGAYTYATGATVGATALRDTGGALFYDTAGNVIYDTH